MLEPPHRTVQYEDEVESCDEEGEDDGYCYELGHGLERRCHFFVNLNPIPSRMYEFIRRYVRARDTLDCLNRETTLLPTLRSEISNELETLRN